jgi:hypothetical protein
MDCFAPIFRSAFGVNSELGKAADPAHIRAMCYYGDLIE